MTKSNTVTPDQIIKLCAKHGLKNATVKIRHSLVGNPLTKSDEQKVMTFGATPGPSFYDLCWVDDDGVEHWFECCDDISKQHMEVLILVLATGGYVDPSKKSRSKRNP